jgi:hypothetical protein
MSGCRNEQQCWWEHDHDQQQHEHHGGNGRRRLGGQQYGEQAADQHHEHDGTGATPSSRKPYSTSAAHAERPYAEPRGHATSQRQSPGTSRRPSARHQDANAWNDAVGRCRGSRNAWKYSVFISERRTSRSVASRRIVNLYLLFLGTQVWQLPNPTPTK